MISILCVDDEQDLLEVAQIFLEESGEFKVEISTSAQEALNVASIAAYDAIVSDYLMPGMNGIEFLKEIRRRCGDIPFILFTGRGREEVVIEAINNGADFYLQKGGDPEAQFAELTHKIRQAVAWRRAEHQRTESEKRLLDIINFLPDATFAIDRSGQVISWNRAMEEMTGWRAIEMLGKREYEYAVPFYGMRRPMLIDLVFAPQDEIRQRYASVHIDKEILTGETIDATPRGRTCILWGMAAPLYNNEGALVGAIESIRDITARREAEEALRKSEQTLRINEERLVMAQEIGQIGSWEYKLHTDTIWGSAEGLRIFGFPPVAGELPIAAIEACIPDRDRVHQALVDLITKGDAYNLEYGIHPADGSSPRVIHAIARLEKDAGGTLVRIRGVIQDITERKRGEDEIVFKNIILSTQQETTLDAILIVDENGKILSYNQNFIRIWGIPDRLLVSQEDEQVLHYVNEQLTDPDAFLARVRYLYDHKEEKSFEELPLKDGRVLERFSAPMLGVAGRYYGRVWYFRDISERKQAEESLHRQFRFMQKLIDTIPNPVFFKDTQGIYRGCNTAFEQFVGLPTEQIIGKTLYDIAPRHLADSYYAYDQALFKKPGTRTFESQLRFADGSLRDVILNKATFVDDEGNAILVGVVQDISERKRAEAGLRQSEEKFRGMAERISDIVLLVDNEFHLTYLSPSFLRMLGMTSSDSLEKPLPLNILAHSDQEKILAAFLANKALKTTGPLEISFPVPGGEARILEFHGVPIQNEGVFQGVQLIAHDITSIRRAQEELRLAYEQLAASEEELRENYDELHKHEQALRESEAKFRRLAENAPDMIYRMSLPSGTYEYISPASLALSGYTPEEFYADPFLIRTLIHPAWRDYFHRQWASILRGEVPPFYEYQIIDRAGTTHWINQRNMVVRDEQGKVVTLEAIATDITRQKETEQELKRSELRSLAANDNAGSLIWEVDTDGLYRYASPAVMRILGYRPDELVGKMHFYDLFDPAVRDQLKADVLAGFSRHEPFRNFVNTNRHKNGTEVILTTSAAPVFDEDGAFSGYCGVDEDITQRIAAESAIQALVKSIVGTTGLTSLRHITENISSWLGADCVMIGEILPDNQTVKVLSMLLDGKDVPDYIYTLKGTPCDNVAEKGFCLYPDNVIQLFPESRDLVELNIRGYIGTPLKDSTGKIFGILCALSRSPIRSIPAVQEIMDIIAVKAAAEIERSQIERTLEKSRQMLGEAMDMAGLANWEFDIASGMFTFDDRFYALYGTTAKREGGNLMPAEVYAREFVYKDDRHLVREEVERALTTTDPGYTARVEHRIVRRDGEIRHIVVRIGIIKDAKGRTIKTHGANQDITEIKRAEAALRETEGRFRSLVETSPGVIWEVDTLGRFLYISPMVKTLLGYAPDELIGESITGLVIERLQPTVLKILKNFISSPDVPMQPFEIIARHRDGHDLVMEIRPFRVIDPHGMLTMFRGVAFDTTARKKAEEALKRANRQLTLMSSITRHDLLNKITVILGNLKLAEKKATDPGQEEYLKKIRYATSAIKAQIEFTRIYQNLGTNEPQWLTLNSLMPRSYVPDTISLHAEVGGIRIYADPMLERVFFNLLDNAIRHGETVTEIRVSSHRSGSDLLVVWEDNGIGIAPEDKEQIFDRGFGKNTGLGLFLVREILSLTGITIRETGEPGKGVRFELAVPQGAYEIDAGQ